MPGRSRARAGEPVGGGPESGDEEGGGDGLSLMQLELSEEDLPAVVPYEEVRATGNRQ